MKIAIVITYLRPTRTKQARMNVHAHGYPTRYYPYDHGARNPYESALDAYLASNFGAHGILGVAELDDNTNVALVELS